jgi:hypothetical protein
VPADTLILLNNSQLLKIKELNLVQQFNVYPNPSRGYFKTTNIDQDTELFLFNSLGEMIFRRKVKVGENLNFEVITPGIYNLWYKNKLNSGAKKIIVL